MAQRAVSSFAGSELSKLLGAEVSIGNINLGFLNRIILENVRLKDEQGAEMLSVARVSAAYDIAPLFKGMIDIGSAQLFGFNAHLNKETPDAKPNFQFIVDALSSDDNKEPSHIDLRINSLLVRRGNITYDVLSEADDNNGIFNTNHLQFNNMRANVSIKALRNDSINASIRQFSFEETKSGFALSRFDFRIISNNQQTIIDNFDLQLPNTTLMVDTIAVHYDSIGALNNYADNAHFSVHLQPSDITLQDIAAFVPNLKTFRDKILVELIAEGTINDLHLPILKINGNHLRINGNADIQDIIHPERTSVQGQLSEVYADPEGFSFIMRNLSSNYEKLPEIVNNLGSIMFTGNVSGPIDHIVTHGNLKTELGSFQGNMQLISDNEKGTFGYVGDLKTVDFALGTLLENDDIGNISFSLDLNTTHSRIGHPKVFVKGVVDSLSYSGYTYHNITLDGESQNGGYNGTIALDDANAYIKMVGTMNMLSRIPVFDFNADIEHFRPADLHLSNNYKDSEISLSVEANFVGSSIDDMIGELNINNMLYATTTRNYCLDNFKVAAVKQENGTKKLTFTSNFLQGNIEGDYSYRTLPNSVISVIDRYLPSLFRSRKARNNAENNFTFDLQLDNSEFVSALLQIPLTIYTPSTLKGFFNDKERKMRIEGFFPRFMYDGKFLESGVLLAETPTDQFHITASVSDRNIDDDMNYHADISARNDSVFALMNWGNNGEHTYSGRLSTLVSFLQPEQQEEALSEDLMPLKANVEISPSDVIINDTLWNIHRSQLLVEGKSFHVNDFLISQDDRYLRINGDISESKEDTVFIDMKDITLTYVFEIADLGVSFDGDATGKSYAVGVLKEPFLYSDLDIKDFGTEGYRIGDMAFHGEWHHQKEGLWVEADIHEDTIAFTHVDGYIYPIKPTSSLDLDVKARGTNIRFLQYFLSGVTPDFYGRIWGDVHFFGKFKALTVEADKRVDAMASIKIEMLNTNFVLHDSIQVRQEGITFSNSHMTDHGGEHEGRLNGFIQWNHFSDVRYDLKLDLNNMLVLNTQQSVEYPFYGVVYGTGNAHIYGDDTDGMRIDAAITTNRNTTFNYMKDGITTASGNQFVTFNDKTPHRAILDSIPLSDFEQVKRIEQEEEDSHTMDTYLNILADVTPEATFRIIMDPIVGDNISFTGSGNLRANYYNKGDFNMFGTYTMDKGVYKLSMQEIIRKDLQLQEGSTLTFIGDPLEAQLDWHAKYTVNSASLNDLIPNASSFVNQTSVKVNCLLDITGNMTQPELKLGLELPQESDEVQSLVKNYIPTEEQMNMQILYLLSIGKFYTPAYVNVSQNSNVMSSVVSSTLSGQLNSALSNIINSNNWNFGTNLSTGQNGWNDFEVEGILSGQLLNNRLLLNGNFGYRENRMSNTSFVGDFDAQLLLNESGSIRLKAYNQTNDRYFVRTNPTTQGFGIIFKKDFNRWNELLFWRNKKKKETKVTSPKEENPGNTDTGFVIFREKLDNK
ncbi:MAG: translocation/assembly module TamB domain-containing protein [Bacteroidaceae bacterium]|nr:translocation/assembly module TamB domain-containing protein [Bacteroidaceae bacterium]